MSAPLLRLSGVQKAFGGVRALTNGALALRAGQITALIGENGAGKSTLVKILTGVHQPDAGTIELAGQSVRIADPRAAARLGIAAVHQESAVFDALSAAENILIADPPRRYGLIDKRAMRTRAAALLASLGAKIDPETPAAKLSIAEKQFVQIARGLAQDARVLIFDEPTAALSQHEADELLATIRRLRDEGKAILFISHKFPEIFALCDRYAVFRDGAAVGEGRIAETNAAQLISLMVGRDMAETYPPRAGALGEERLRIEKLGRRGEFADVSFSVRAGEILGLYGLVGAGRSEVAQSIFGLSPADAGQIFVEGKSQTIASPANARAAAIAYVPEDRQHQGLALTLSIDDNIALASLDKSARFGIIDKKAEHARAAALATRLQIKMGDAADPVQSLSGGNQQKVVLSKWLATEPRILILDEPTKGVDVGAKAAVHQTMRDLASQGMAIVMISSELPEVLGMSDNVLVMRRGRVQGLVPANDATPDAIMSLAAHD